MKSLFPLLLLGLAAAAPAQAQTRGDHRDAFHARREGRILPVREIERRVVPSMPGAEYMGFDFDSGPGIYTLKFLRDGRVIWVDVDGRTGNVLGRTR
jgi:hypothetical protein